MSVLIGTGAGVFIVLLLIIIFALLIKLRVRKRRADRKCAALRHIFSMRHRLYQITLVFTGRT